MSDIEIIPYVGAGTIRFGMTMTEVHRAIGQPPAVSEVDFLGELSEDYGDWLVTYDKAAQRVVELGFCRSCVTLKYKDLYLFTEDPLSVYVRLCRDDGQPYERRGFLILLNRGITMTGFHDGAVDDMAVTVFSRGRWDEYRPKLKPFDIDPYL